MLPVFLTKSPEHRRADEAYFFKKLTSKRLLQEALRG
jgi:hypothetical protein